MDQLRWLRRRLIPFRVRLELLRLARLPKWLAERRTVALSKASDKEAAQYPFLLASHSSPLERVAGALDAEVQLGKETNVGLAAGLLDRLIVEPNQVFSHHHAVGRTTKRRGFRKGLELRNGESEASVGGGLCQVSNSFYWVAVKAGMRITERHRHGLDLFPDHERTVPFGCGATVVYNYADFCFENPLPVRVMMAARVDDGDFVSEIWAECDPGHRIEVEEVDHRFFRDGDQWWRENRLRRRITTTDGVLLVDQEVAHNRGRVMYEPSEED
ncbi:MAG: VanW family protein, partial [bacterium]|nr:VanW family protein [bacterium]